MKNSKYQRLNKPTLLVLSRVSFSLSSLLFSTRFQEDVFSSLTSLYPTEKANIFKFLSFRPQKRCCTKSVEASSSLSVCLLPLVFFPTRDKINKAKLSNHLVLLWITYFVHYQNKHLSGSSTFLCFDVASRGSVPLCPCRAYINVGYHFSSHTETNLLVPTL